MNDNSTNNNNETVEPAHDTGVFSSNRKGFGFIKPDDGSEDIFVAAKNVNGAFHKDKVKFKVIRAQSENSNREARIEKILERTITDLVGTYTACEKFGFVKPDIGNIGTDIFIPGKKSKKAQENDKVLIHIDNYGGDKKRPDGSVVEILGQKGSKGVDILSVIKGYGIPTDFSPESLSQAAKIPDFVSEKEMEGRIDYRNEFTITIDGEDTKDFDDAFSLKYEDGVYHLGIHIADVTHYVKENSFIDKEAVVRGTSVYPVDRVIPMIPEKLSTGICSLVENEPRLTLSCIMDFNDNGEMISRDIKETVITVNKRLTYSEVSDMIGNPSKYNDKESLSVMPTINAALKLTDMFRKMKKDRGAIDFDFPESEITLDENGHAIDIKPRERDAATGIIEELMLKSNETVAEIISVDREWGAVPVIYRSHETPDVERIEGLKKLVESMGFNFFGKPSDIRPNDIQELLKSIEGTKEERLISVMTLRCMKRAMYSTAFKRADETTVTPVSHFGIAAPYYCHFTSPIRRYPDFVNHRIIKKKIAGKYTDEDLQKYKKNLPDMAQHFCETEHRALEAERDSTKIKMAEYMSDRIGEVFEGEISGMAPWGMYVLLPSSVEGMIPVSSLDDGYYNFDEEKLIMEREDGKRAFHIGDEIKIKVETADPEIKIIDFTIV